jgi:transcriptional regulator with XRE-family HTH domain
MARSPKDRMSTLPMERRRRVEARAAELIAEELSLRDIRKAREKTQTAIARRLGIGQEGVSRIEKRSDLMLSTLRSYIEAMGGELHLVAEFPDRPPVELRGLGRTDPAGEDLPAAPDPQSERRQKRAAS